MTNELTTYIPRIIIVEDDFASQLLFQRIIEREGYLCSIVSNGMEVLKMMELIHFDVIVTDWMMPEMDGIELIRKIREQYENPPFIMMVTALANDSAKKYALQTGADVFIPKPLDVENFVSLLKSGIEKRAKVNTINTYTSLSETDKFPPMVAVGIAASTGGPHSLSELLKVLDPKLNAAIFIIQHGPFWIIENLVERFGTETKFKISVAKEGEICQNSNIYFAPGNAHLRIKPKQYSFTLDNDPLVSFVRPSADLLFQSIAEAFGKYSIGVVLSGLGRDGTDGVAKLINAGGQVIVQSPESAIAPSMPASVISSGAKVEIVDLKDIADLINKKVALLSEELENQKI